MSLRRRARLALFVLCAPLAAHAQYFGAPHDEYRGLEQFLFLILPWLLVALATLAAAWRGQPWRGRMLRALSRALLLWFVPASVAVGIAFLTKDNADAAMLNDWSALAAILLVAYAGVIVLLGLAGFWFVPPWLARRRARAS